MAGAGPGGRGVHRRERRARPGELAERRELRRHPSLLPYQLAVYAAVERDLANEVARRMDGGPDTLLRSRLIAATFLTALRVATQQSLDEPGEPVGELIRRSVSYVAG